MYAVGRIGSYISRGVDTVAAPFHPFGGAVDMIVVRQADGSLKSSPWYVRFGKFQGVLKTREKVVNITVNGVDADFHMYLDHKGEAYFINEVNVEEDEAVVYRSSSGEDADKHLRSKRLTKSNSFEMEVKQPNSARQADGRDECKREHDAWNASRRARILGLVFGSRSFKERMSQESPEAEELKRARLLERAEIAADLLEIKWSTTLATKKSKGNKTSHEPMTTDFNNDVVLDKEETRTPKTSICFEKVEHDSDSGELVNDSVRMELSDACNCTGTNSGNTEQTAEVKSPMKYSVFVAQESSDRLKFPATQENQEAFGDDLCNGAPERNNMILDVNAVIGIRLVTDDSVDNEISEVIHPTDVVISRTGEDKCTEMEHAEVSESCGSCISEEEVVGSEVIEFVDQSCSHVVDSDSHNIENVSESSHDVGGHQDRLDNSSHHAQSTSFQTPSVTSDEDQFCFSDLDDSRLKELRRADSTSPHRKSCATGGDSESPKEADECNIYQSFSSSGKVDQHKLPNVFEDHFKIPDVTHQQTNENEEHIAGSIILNKGPDLDTAQAIDIHNRCHSLDSYKKSTSFPYEMPLAQESDDLGKNTSFTEGISPEPVNVADKPWGIWPFTFKRSRSMKSVSRTPRKTLSCNYPNGPEQDADATEPKQKVTLKKIITTIPTTEQLESLNLKEGRNEVTFTFSTAMLGDQKVDARIYVWKWNSRIVISDVDGTITRSDVLGQVMPLVGMDWSHIGVTQLFSAIKENGYQVLFLSARAISQAYHTRQFLFNLKQNGMPLPDGPVVISPDGLFPSLFREVIRRAPHEFKIACLEDIKACFPSDCNPFYAGFGNRDTDEFSYLKVGIPKGKIFIINPKGEVAVHRRHDTKSYTSLHALVNGIFPPTSSTEQEDFNTWNFWKLPPPTL